MFYFKLGQRSASEHEEIFQDLLKEMCSHLSQEVVSADQIPVPHLHTQKAVSQSLVQLKLKTFIPAWVTGLLNHLEEAGSW